MSNLTSWLAVAGAGVVTFALRLSFIVLLGRIALPILLSRALRFVPAAVFTAVVPFSST
jgi:branched-subunit amino acid transport protein